MNPQKDFEKKNGSKGWFDSFLTVFLIIGIPLAVIVLYFAIYNPSELIRTWGRLVQAAPVLLGSLAVVGAIIFFGFLILNSLSDVNQRRFDEIERAKNAYYESLSLLKNNPMNPDIRQRALYLGRIYANLTRNKQGVALFDEVALLNDINAACAGGVNTTPNIEPPANTSIETRLEQLMKLREKGLITEQEYQEKKQTILSEI